MWFFTPKPKTTRLRLAGGAVRTLVSRALAGKTLPNFRLFMQKNVMGCPTKALVRKAADQALKPWRKDVWECEDQARALVHQCQLTAANEGCSWAVGTLRADAPEGSSHELHVFVWVILDTPGGPQFTLFDPTADEWADVPDLTEVDYAIT